MSIECCSGIGWTIREKMYGVKGLLDRKDLSG